MATTPHSSWNLSVLSIRHSAVSVQPNTPPWLISASYTVFLGQLCDFRFVTQPSKSTMTSIRGSDLWFSPECGLQGFLVSPVQLGNRRRHHHPAIQTDFQLFRNCLA